MSLVLVTGLSGVGKSTVLRVLLERGNEAYGFDEDRFGEWFDSRTGAAVEFPTTRGDDDGTDQLEFRVHVDRIEALAAHSTHRPIYLCGGASHEFGFWELLDLVIYLSADDETLEQRLAARTDNGYGQTPEELAGILQANRTFESMYRDHGAVIVDATRSIDQVVEDVTLLARAHTRTA